MNNTVIATLGGVCALIGWGTSDYLAARVSRKFSGFETNWSIQLPGLVIAPLLLFLTGQHIPPAEHFLVIALSSVCFTSAYLLFIKALSTGAVGIVVPLANAFPLITLVLTVIFLSTKFSGAQIFSMVAIVVGAILLAAEKNRQGKSFRETHIETLLAIAAACAWGLGFFIINTIVAKETWQIISGLLSLYMGVFAIVLILVANKKSAWPKIKNVHKNHLGLFAGFILTMSTIGFYAAGHHTGNILIPAVVGSAGPLITSMLASVIDKESINVVKRIGAVIVVGGIVLLNAVS